MAPSSSPWGRGFRRSGEGSTGLTLLWDSTAFLNWVYTSGSLTTPRAARAFNLPQIEKKKQPRHPSSPRYVMEWKIISVVQRGPPAGVNFDLQLCADIFHSFLHIQFFGSDLQTQGREIKTRCDATVRVRWSSSGPWSTSSWKATVLTEPSCLMRLATTSSGLPRLTMRLLSHRCKNRHMGKSHTTAGRSASWLENYGWRKSSGLPSSVNRAAHRLRCILILKHLNRSSPKEAERSILTSSVSTFMKGTWNEEMSGPTCPGWAESFWGPWYFPARSAGGRAPSLADCSGMFLHSVVGRSSTVERCVLHFFEPSRKAASRRASFLKSVFCIFLVVVGFLSLNTWTVWCEIGFKSFIHL